MLFMDLRWLIEFIEEKSVEGIRYKKSELQFFWSWKIILGSSTVCLPFYRSLGRYLVLVSEQSAGLGGHFTWCDVANVKLLW